MVRKSITSKELQTMTQAERRAACDELIEAAEEMDVEEYRAGLDIEIAAYEQRFGYTTGEMIKALDSGELEESVDITSWLMLVAQRRTK